MIARVATMLLALAIGGAVLAPREVATQVEPAPQPGLTALDYRNSLDACQRQLTVGNLRKPVPMKRRAKA